MVRPTGTRSKPRALIWLSLKVITSMFRPSRAATFLTTAKISSAWPTEMPTLRVFLSWARAGLSAASDRARALRPRVRWRRVGRAENRDMANAGGSGRRFSSDRRPTVQALARAAKEAIRMCLSGDGDAIAGWLAYAQTG